MSRQHPNIYEFRGELLTAREIRDKYGIPERLVWKGIHDPRKPSLEKMISWREQHGVFSKTDYRYADSCKQRPRCVMQPKKQTYKFTYIEPEPIQYDHPALPEYFKDESVVIPDKPSQIRLAAVVSHSLLHAARCIQKDLTIRDDVRLRHRTLTLSA